MYIGGFMNYIFIINPTSGNNKGIEVGKVIEEYCKSIKVQYKIIYTNKNNDAKNIAESYKSYENSIIYSVGGDGTLNEVINGIANSKVKLGLIPIGTGNDFYKTLIDFKGDKIDLGKVNDKYFINIASLGLDAEIANYANKLKKYNLPNNIVYVSSLAKNYFSYKPIKLGINNIYKDTTILTICNGKYYGGGFKIAPNSKLNDGMFDVFDVKSLNKLEIINLLAKLVKAKHIGDKNINFYKTDSLYVNSSIPINCNIDGEIIKGNYFNFSIEKEAINIDSKDQLKINEFLRVKKIIK